MDDGWEDLGAVAARVVKGLAPAGGGPASASAQGVKRLSRAHHNSGGGTAVVIFVDFGKAGATQPCGPTWTPRRFRDRTPDSGACTLSIHNVPPATGGLGNALRAK